MPLLQIRDLAKTFPAADGAPDLPILRGIDLDLEPGDSLAIVGPSGCGKSTLLNLIAGLDRPSAGSIVVDGQTLAGLSDAALSDLRLRRIGMVFQLHHLLPQLSLIENATLPGLAARLPPDALRPRAEALLRRVGLGDRLQHRPAQLSGGERQRAALVRALIMQPRLLLADEPTGALDAASAVALADLLAELNAEEGVALLVVTHAADLAARQARRLQLRDGRLQP